MKVEAAPEPAKRKQGRPRNPVTVAGDPPEEWLMPPKDIPTVETPSEPSNETPKVNIVEEKVAKEQAPIIDSKTRLEMEAGRKALARLRGE